MDRNGDAVTDLDCTKLNGRMRSICEGTSGLPAETEAEYRKLWASQDVGATYIQTPGFVQKFWNLTSSIVAFVADGCTTVSQDEYAKRLNICDGCDQRDDDKCKACGCMLSLKARGRAFECPLKKWPEIAK